MLSRLKIKKIKKKLVSNGFKLRHRIFPFYDFWPKELGYAFSKAICGLVYYNLKEDVRYNLQWVLYPILKNIRSIINVK